MERIKEVLFPEPESCNLPFSTDLIRDVTNNFSIPIEFLHDKQVLYEHIKNDIELDNVYGKVFGPSTEVSKCLHEKWGNYTTNNIRFLKDTQTIVNNTQRISKCDKAIWDEDTNKLSYYWHDIRNPRFCGKYSFLEWSLFKPLNYSIHRYTLNGADFHISYTRPVINLIRRIWFYFHSKIVHNYGTSCITF